VHAVGDCVGGRDFDVSEPRRLKPFPVLTDGQSASDAAGVVATLDAVVGGELVLGHDVGDAETSARLPQPRLAVTAPAGSSSPLIKCVEPSAKPRLLKVIGAAAAGLPTGGNGGHGSA
jgi:hypothetical protein